MEKEFNTSVRISIKAVDAEEAEDIITDLLGEIPELIDFEIKEAVEVIV